MNRSQWITLVAGLTGLYEIVVASRVLNWLGIYYANVQHRAVSLVLVLLLIYLNHSARGELRRRGILGWWDVPLLLAGIVGAGFVAIFYERALDYSLFGYLDAVGIVLAGLLAISLLEAMRRTTGWVLPAIVCLMLLMTTFQNYLPGLLHGKGFPLDRLTYSFYVGSAGIFGLPLGVAVSIIIVFLVYARLLQQAGVGEWFTDIALSVTGASTGGPAKAAVVSSGLFGMISGSPSGNVATTGAFTIPMMIKTGYPPAVAAAVEAVASTGGSILPPVMGAVAFVMAEWIGVSYGEIALVAFIPALLYYVIAFASVHFEAKRRGLKPIGREGMPSLWATLKRGWFYPIPLVALVYFLIALRWPPDIAGMLSLPFLIGCSFFSRNREHWLLPRPLFLGLAAAIRSWVPIAAVTAGVGMLIGALEISGLAVRVPSFLLDVSAGNLAFTLILVGIASLILGMGLDSIPAYITLAALAAPALITLGLSPMAAHLYVVYWGLASYITPPVCLAVFVACGLSGSKIWATGWESVKLGIAIYVVPIAFAFDQSLLLQGPIDKIVISVVTALVGAVTVAAGLRGYAVRPMNAAQRVISIAAGLMLIAPDIALSASGLVLIAAVIVWQLRTSSMSVPEPAVGQT